MSDPVGLEQLANVPIGVAGLWIAWWVARQWIAIQKKKLEQDAAREIAERAERIAETKEAREERREERAERRESTSAITRLTATLEQHADLEQRTLEEIKEARCRYSPTADLYVPRSKP